MKTLEESIKENRERWARKQKKESDKRRAFFEKCEAEWARQDNERGYCVAFGSRP